jgi:AmmeMemoRadiSam system protein B
VYSERLNLSGANVLETPLGNLNVDHDVRRDLMATGLFDLMTSEVDADEHSLEMQVSDMFYLTSA